jgi:hypothetical protein
VENVPTSRIERWRVERAKLEEAVEKLGQAGAATGGLGV